MYTYPESTFLRWRSAAPQLSWTERKPLGTMVRVSEPRWRSNIGYRTNVITSIVRKADDEVRLSLTLQF